MSDQNESQPVAKRVRQRSPSYPAIALPQAIERAEQVYKREGRNPAPIGALVSHWGYGAKSSGGKLTLAALRRYGLIEDQKAGQQTYLKLSRLALDILLAGHDEAKRANAVRAAALSPAVNREILEKFPHGLPSDQNLHYYLVVERGFTDGAAEEYIPRLRDTVAYADLLEGARLSHNGQDQSETSPAVEGVPNEAPMSSAASSPTLPDARGSAYAQGQQAGLQTVQVPYAPGKWATVQAAFPISESAWTQFVTVLNVMKPGLTTPDES